MANPINNTFTLAAHATSPTYDSKYPNGDRPLGGGSGSFALTVETLDVAPHYMKTGVPFAQGDLSDLAHIRVLDGATELAISKESLALWPDGSYKNVLVGFEVTPSAVSDKTYTLEYGVSSAVTGGLTVDEQAAYIDIDTGDTVFRLSKTSLSIFESVTIGATQVCNGGELLLTNALDTNTYLASAGTVAYTILHQDTVSCTIQADATAVHTGTALGELTAYYVFTDGSGEVEFDLTVVDSTLEADVNGNKFTASAFPFALEDYTVRLDHVGMTAFTLGTTSGNSETGTISGDHYVMQKGNHNISGNAITPSPSAGLTDPAYDFEYNCSEISAGADQTGQCVGWALASNGTNGIYTCIQGFWEQFPNELLINTTNIDVSLFPARSVVGGADTSYPTLTSYNTIPNTMYFPREGGAKSRSVLFGFVASPSVAAIQKRNTVYQEDALNIRCPAQVYCDSKVWGDIEPASTAAIALENEIYTYYILKAMDPVDRPYGLVYGWRDYGDTYYAGGANYRGVDERSFYNDTHVGATQYYQISLKSGNKDYWTFAQKRTRHYMDIDVSHGARYGYHKNSSNTFIQTPAGEPHLIKHEVPDHHCRNAHFGHLHTSGLVELYLLTGNRRAKVVLDEIAGWCEARGEHTYPIPRPATYNLRNRAYAEEERSPAWWIHCINEYTRGTGDYTRHNGIGSQFITFMTDWWKEVLPHGTGGGLPTPSGLVTDPRTNSSSNDASVGTGYWTMDSADNGGGTGTNPWMGGMLLTTLLAWYRLEEEAGNPNGKDMLEIRNMMYQCLNYICKWGRGGGDAYFVYSEPRTASDAATQLVYPLFKLHDMYTADVNAGNISNGGVIDTAWFETVDNWNSYAISIYNDSFTGDRSSNYPFGPYGYEFGLTHEIWPLIGDHV